MPSSIVVMIAVSSSDSSIFATLKSLEGCQCPLDASLEVVLIENGSKSLLMNSLNGFNLNIKYLYSPVPNKSKALNLGLMEVGNDTLVIFTDADIKFNTEFISAYYAIASKNPSGYYFGGPLEVEYEKRPKGWMIKSLPASAKGWKYDETNLGFKQQFFLGCNWAAFGKDLKNTSGFNEQIGPGTKPRRSGQETDMQVRLRQNGIQPLYVPQNNVTHYVPKNSLTIKWILRRKYQEGFSIGMGFRKDVPVVFTNLLMNLSKKMLKMAFSLFFLPTDIKLYSVGLFVESMGRVSGYVYAKKNKFHFK